MTQYSQVPTITVLYWRNTQPHHLVTIEPTISSCFSGFNFVFPFMYIGQWGRGVLWIFGVFSVASACQKLWSWTSWEIGENRWMNFRFWGMPKTSSCSVSKMKVYPGNWKLEVASQFTSISMLDTCWILKYMLWLIWWYMKGTFQSICWFVTLKHYKIQTFYPKYHNPLFPPESDVLRLYKCTVAT